MRILWVKANKILPAHSGGDIRSLNILEQLAKRDEVIFLSYYDGTQDPGYEKELQERLPGAACVCTGKRVDSQWRRGWDYLRAMPDAVPYAVGRFASAVVQEKIRECVAQSNPDVVVCDFLDAAINFPESVLESPFASRKVPTILFQHNVESEIWRRHASNGRGGVVRMLYRREYGKMLRFERATVGKFDHLIAVSAGDRDLMSDWVELDRISVVPAGVDVEKFSPGRGADGTNPLVVFVGAMDWKPNIDAVKYFCAEIWPEVLEQNPAARFRVVGRNPDRRVTALAEESVEVTGTVLSVVEHLRAAQVVVVPLRIGGGTRLKIYEAMAVGKAVVSTSVGAEGLDVHPGQDVILADSPEEFAAAVIELLQDSGTRGRMGRAANLLARKYAWPGIADQFREVLRQVAGEGVEASQGIECKRS